MVTVTTIENMKEMLEIQGRPGNYDQSPYMRGMYNGMEFMLAMVEEREPVYIDAPKERLSWGEALYALKSGQKVCRDGWNGKGLFIVYQKGYPQGIPCNKQTAAAWGMNEGDLFVCNPYLQIKQADGSHSMWAPSVGDALAEDWMIVE